MSLIMKTENIELNGKQFEIKAMEFRKLLKVVGFIKGFPEKVQSKIAGIDIKKGAIDNTKILGVFAELLEDSESEIFDVLSLASGVPVEDLGGLSIAETTRLLRVLFEVNEVEEIKKEFGELAEMFKQPKNK